MADHHRHLHRLLALPVLNENIIAALIRAGHKAKLLLAMKHRAINAGILHSGFRIAQNEDRRGDVLTGIELLMAQYRKLCYVGISAFPDDLFNRYL